MKSQQKFSIVFIKKSFVALSVAGILSPVFAVGDITNTNEPKKEQTIGTPAQGDTLTGSITTSGNNSNTIVNLRGESKMEQGQISASSTSTGGANTGASNTIILQENSILNLTPKALPNLPQPPNPPQLPPLFANVQFSILANGLNAKNTISDITTSDITTGAAKGSIKGAIIAFDKGENIINNLRNTQVGGAIIADGAGSKNTISFDAGTTFTGYIAALRGGINTITLNEGAKLNMTQKEPTENASMLAEAANSSNTIKGTTKETNIIENAIVAKNGGTNTIDLHDLQMKSDIKAIGADSTNTITLEKGFLTNIITRDSDTTKNTINLNGESSIKGHISNLIAQNPPAGQKNGINTILLNQHSALNLNKGTNIDDAAILSINGENSISGNSDGEHKISGNIVAKQQGKNILTLDKLSMTGDITADERGSNIIQLGNFGSDKSSKIKGKAEVKNGGKNELFFTKVTLEGDINAMGADSQNETRLLDSLVTGDIIAEQQGKNILILGNGGTDAKVEGAIKAQNNGTNKIDFNNGEVVGGIFAESGSNEITLGHHTFTGKIKSNIEASNRGTNTITIQSVDMIGTITAKQNGNNTITDARPFDRQSTIEGSIAARDGGTNTITLKNIAITQGITAGGGNAKNTITLGDNQESIVTSNIIADAQGRNEITFTKTTNLIGTITAKQNGNNVITENQTIAANITGGILADGGTNTITLTHAVITEGITAKNTGTNTLTIQGNDKNRVLASDLIAESGGANAAFIGVGLPNNGNGNLQGSIRSIGEGSRNTLTMQGDSILSGGIVVADAKGNTNQGTTTNTITLNGNSFINLNDRNGEGGALSATGQNAKNTLTGTSTSASEITGDVVADFGDKATAGAMRAENAIALNKLRISGDVNAFQAGLNTLSLAEGDIIGNILAQDNGQNTLNAQTSSQVEILGTFYAREGGSNEIKLYDKANISITSNNNDKVFQAVGAGATNTIQEINATTTLSLIHISEPTRPHD